jgi:hypothetical protein
VPSYASAVRKESNRAGNEGQLEVALPIRTGRHDYELLRNELTGQLRAAPDGKIEDGRQTAHSVLNSDSTHLSKNSIVPDHSQPK